MKLLSKRRIALVTLFPFILLTMTGCWDRTEIEERAFVLGVALDLAEVNPEEEKDVMNQETYEEWVQKGRPTRYRYSVQIAVPSQIAAGQEAQGGGGLDPKPYLNVSSISHSIMDANRLISHRISRPMFYEHLKFIAISDQIAKSEHVGRVLDFFLRDHEMRRRMRFFVIEEDASKLLEIRGHFEPVPALYIDQIAQNYYRANRMPHPLSIGELSEELAKTTSYVVRKVSLNRDQVKVAGGILFDGHINEMVGELGEQEIIAYNLITGYHQNGVITLPIGQTIVAFEMFDTNAQIIPTIQDNEVQSFTLKIHVEGHLAEDQSEVRDPLQETYLLSTEKDINKQLKETISQTLDTLQHQLKRDPVGFLDAVRLKDYKVYKKVRDQWEIGEMLFSKIPIQVEVESKIRRIGTAGNPENQRGGR